MAFQHLTKTFQNQQIFSNTFLAEMLKLCKKSINHTVSIRK